jgi:hypothetical protein
VYISLRDEVSALCVVREALPVFFSDDEIVARCSFRKEFPFADCNARLFQA